MITIFSLQSCARFKTRSDRQIIYSEMRVAHLSLGGTRPYGHSALKHALFMSKTRLLTSFRTYSARRSFSSGTCRYLAHSAEMPTGMLQTMFNWINRRRPTGADSVKYNATSNGFHPYKEEEGEYMLAEPASATASKDDSCLETSTADMPGWSAILSMYPELKFDKSFDKRKLGTLSTTYRPRRAHVYSTILKRWRTERWHGLPVRDL